MKTRLLSGFLAVVGGGVAIVGCFEPSHKVGAETPTVVTSPSPAPVNSLSQQPVSNQEIATPVAALPTNLSPGVTEVAKLFQSNVSEDVLLAFINNYGEPFYPNADEILYLNDLGIADHVVTAVINHKAGEPAQRVASAEPQPPAQAQAVEPPPVPAAAPVQATAPLVPQGQVVQAVPAAPAVQVSVDYFHETLSPYGTWVETEYGRCWRPAVVVANPEWRPYGDRGHWIYTDAGWYWASDYSWGWATFHYGRWCSDRRFGWVWAPDTVWGPSWVSWRYSSDYCGWAPLPPLARYGPGIGFTFHNANVGVSFEFGLTDSCYLFVPSRHFCDPHPYRYRESRTASVNIYNRTTVINNYTVINNKTVVNEGIGRHRIEAATKQPVQRVAIHEWPKNSVSATRPDQIHKVGKELVVYKPQAPEAVKPKFSPLRATAPETVAVPSSGRNHNDKIANSNPGAAHGRPVSPAGESTGNTLPNTARPGHGKPANTEANVVAPSREPRSAQVVTQPRRNETSATPTTIPQRSPESVAPRASVAQPRHEPAVTERPKQHSPSVISENRPSATAPQNSGRPQAAPAIPQREAPRVPVQEQFRAQEQPHGNSGRETVSPSRGVQERFDSPRSSVPVAPRYSPPVENRAQAPSSLAPTYRGQSMAPSLPRNVPQQAVTPRGQGQGQGGGQAVGRERSERLAERDPSDRGRGRDRN